MKSIPVKTETQIYNEMITATMVNLFSLSKDSGEIVLEDIEPWYGAHKAFLTIANYTANLYDRAFYVDVNWINYFRLKKQLKGFSFKKAKKRHKNKISVPKEILHICGSYNVSDNAFLNIWYEFYAPRKEENNEN